MPKQDDDEQNAGVMLPRPSMRAEKAYLLALVERWLRPADQLDHLIRQWVIPVPVSRSGAPPSVSRRFLPLKHPRRVAASDKDASIQGNAPLSEVQAAIGRHLRAGVRS